MLEKIKALLIKYREIISYLFFGGLTTHVSFGVYFILNDALHVHYLISQVVSWIAAVTFAFVTNRLWVFENRATTRAGIFRELWQFYASRLFSGVVETLLLTLTVEILHVNENLAKIIVSVVTVILNYVTSKLIVFRRRADNSGKEAQNK